MAKKPAKQAVKKSLTIPKVVLRGLKPGEAAQKSVIGGSYRSVTYHSS